MESCRRPPACTDLWGRSRAACIGTACDSALIRGLQRHRVYRWVPNLTVTNHLKAKVWAPIASSEGGQRGPERGLPSCHGVWALPDGLRAAFGVRLPSDKGFLPLQCEYLEMSQEISPYPASFSCRETWEWWEVGAQRCGAGPCHSTRMLWALHTFLLQHSWVQGWLSGDHSAHSISSDMPVLKPLPLHFFTPQMVWGWEAKEKNHGDGWGCEFLLLSSVYLPWSSAGKTHPKRKEQSWSPQDPKWLKPFDTAMHPQLGVLAVGKKELRGEIAVAPELHTSDETRECSELPTWQFCKCWMSLPTCCRLRCAGDGLFQHAASKGKAFLVGKAESNSKLFWSNVTSRFKQHEIFNPGSLSLGRLGAEPQWSVTWGEEHLLWDVGAADQTKNSKPCLANPVLARDRVALNVLCCFIFCTIYTASPQREHHTSFSSLCFLCNVFLISLTQEKLFPALYLETRIILLHAAGAKNENLHSGGCRGSIPKFLELGVLGRWLSRDPLQHSMQNSAWPKAVWKKISLHSSNTSPFPQKSICVITESSSLEKTFKTTKSNHQCDPPGPPTVDHLVYATQSNAPRLDRLHHHPHILASWQAARAEARLGDLKPLTWLHSHS